MARRVPTTPRVLRVYEMATQAQVEEGMNWYRNAHGFAASLDPSNPSRAAGVIAAFSPRMPWARNAELAARTYAEGFASGALGRSCRAADRIYAGEDPLVVLKGQKVRAFHTLIADPDDPDAVCIDRHAIDVALFARHTDATRPSLHRVGAYDLFARCYRRAADRLGVLPSQVQAITWVAQRSLHTA